MDKRLQAEQKKVTFDFRRTLALLKFSEEHSRAGLKQIDFRSLKGEFGRKRCSFMRITVGGSTEYHDPNNSSQGQDVGTFCEARNLTRQQAQWRWRPVLMTLEMRDASAPL